MQTLRRLRPALALRALLLASGILILGQSCDPRTPTAVAAEAGFRRVLLVSFDTLRADRLDAATMPNLYALSQAGVRFTRAYAQSAWTRPSHYSLLASRYPDLRSLVFEEKEASCRIADSEILLPEVLRARGFVTTAITGGGYLSPGTGFEQGFDQFDRFSALEAALPRVLGWVGSTKANPTFLFLHHYNVHAPYRPPPIALRGRLDSVPLECWGASFDEAGTASGLSERCREAKGGKEFLDALYSAEAWYADRLFGRVLSELREPERWRETLIVVFADHGEGLHDRGQLQHITALDEEILNVPLLFAGGSVPRGVVIDDPVELRDVAPTILALLGLPAQRTFEGRSLEPSWESTNAAPTRTLFAATGWLTGSEASAVAGWEPNPSPPKGSAVFMAAAIRGTEKVVQRGIGSWTSIDRHELRCGELGCRPVAESLDGGDPTLEAELDDWLQRLPATGACVDSAVSDEMLESLRALGYLGAK